MSQTTPQVALPPVTVTPTVPGYEVVRELGRGGMGVVYEALQLSLNRRVALKVLRDGGAPAARDRFRAEAEAVAQLRHPNIVQIIEVGEAAGEPYLVLEFAEGGNLADLLNGTSLPPRGAAELVETLSRAAEAAHQQRIVHRDLKPANVLLVPTRPPSDAAPDPVSRLAGFIPKLGDFGLVKRLDAVPHTTTGVAIGTPSYMAPEQAVGRRDVGPGADVYALGAILYELLTGRPPFVGKGPLDTVLRVIGDEPVPPRELRPRIPRDLETICLMCLRKSPAHRYPTAAALADDLGRLLAGRPIWARSPGWTEWVLKWARQRPEAVVAAVGWLLLAVVTVFGVHLHRIAEEARRSERAADRECGTSLARERAARDAIVEFHVLVSENRLLRAPGLEDLRRELLSRLADLFRRLVATRRAGSAAPGGMECRRCDRGEGPAITGSARRRGRADPSARRSPRDPAHGPLANGRRCGFDGEAQAAGDQQEEGGDQRLGGEKCRDDRRDQQYAPNGLLLPRSDRRGSPERAEPRQHEQVARRLNRLHFGDRVLGDAQLLGDGHQLLRLVRVAHPLQPQQPGRQPAQGA